MLLQTLQHYNSVKAAQNKLSACIVVPMQRKLYEQISTELQHMRIIAEYSH
jgi:hypothetical protein